ncbi:unnamed protein product [Clonostachys solani]|uniref:Heterokaryon incompatibility domain-containing protein n=1 Tax=Clonostachys solani TaxID=160281 RepID=A0A9N9ZE72_9HYPO|nr:unnamed protein product [Clonostachys solani]
MLCTICRQGLDGIWDPSKTKRVCRIDDFNEHFKEGDSNGRVALPIVASHADQHPSQFVFGHHPTPESYKQSVEQGCIVCSGPGHKGQQSDQDPVMANLEYFSVFTIDIRKNDAVMEIFKPGTRMGGQHLVFYEGSPRDYNFNLSPLTGDAATWALIQSWVDTCIESHERCNQETNYIPQYLLQLDKPNGLFRLVSADQVGPHSNVRYCTLSHCYSADSHQLTSSTLEALSRPQPLSSLSLTYQDAFAVMSHLGVNYLWIDHLCTLQDRPFTDRERRDVFSNSFCGIGATGSTSPSSGLFTKRTPELSFPTIFEFPLGVDGDTAMVRFNEPNAGDFRDEPLIKTARGFQERLLTPRMIHFTASLIYWECYGALCSEMNPQNMVLLPKYYTAPETDTVLGSQNTHVSNRSLAAPAWKRLIMVLPPPYPNADDRDAILDSWFHLLRTYTRCSHEAPEERLSCVETAAMDTKALLKKNGHDDIYLAGMWKDTLPAALVWTVEAAADGRPAQYQGPSWSWSAVDGAISYDYRKMRQDANDNLCKLIDDKYEAGTAAAGSLTLRGKLAVGKLCHHDYNDWVENGLMPEDVLRTRHGAQMDIAELVDPDAGASLGKAPDDTDHLHEWCVRFDTKHDMKEEVSMLPVSLVPAGNPSLGVTVYGIALTKSVGGVYTRSGMWQISLSSKGEAREAFKGLVDGEITIV